MTIAARAGMDETERLLLSAVAGGDEKAFRTLYHRHAPRLRALVLRLLGGHQADADDAAQEAWIRAVASLKQFRGDAAFGSWLAAIGIRVAWEIIRRRRRWSEMPIDEPGLDPPRIGERLDLEQALACLPDGYRLVVMLHDVEGYGHEEIARTLDLAIGTSRSHLCRARRALRAMLSSYERIVT